MCPGSLLKQFTVPEAGSLARPEKGLSAVDGKITPSWKLLPKGALKYASDSAFHFYRNAIIISAEHLDVVSTAHQNFGGLKI